MEYLGNQMTEESHFMKVFAYCIHHISTWNGLRFETTFKNCKKIQSV